MKFFSLRPLTTFKSLYSKKDLQTESILLPILFAREYNIGTNSKIPTYNPFAPYHAQASKKTTDILGHTGDIYRGFYAKNKILPLLNSFHLSSHIIFPINYEYRGEQKNDISFLYIYENLIHNISFEESSFISLLPQSNNSEFNWEAISVKNLDDFFALEHNYNRRILPKKIVLTNTEQYDLFGFFGLSVDLYISSKMYNELKGKITGLDIQEINFEIVFS
jgi:hypothetical protein